MPVEKILPVEDKQSTDIPLRVIVIGLVVVIVNSYWVSVNNLVIGLVHNYMSLFSNAVFTLFVLILLNLLLRKFLP